MAFTVQWREWVRHGLCVGVGLPPATAEVSEEVIGLLHPEEQAFARRFGPRRRATWVGGRLALRAALDEAGVRAGPVLATPRGAPALPPGVAGSISHKRGLAAVALVRAEAAGATLGVDLETEQPRRDGIAPQVLTAAEQDELAALADGPRWRELLLRFTLKEALYKALDPWMSREVGFHEAEVRPGKDGSAAVRLCLRAGEGTFEVDACWWPREPGLLLAAARVRPVAR